MDRPTNSRTTDKYGDREGDSQKGGSFLLQHLPQHYKLEANSKATDSRERTCIMVACSFQKLTANGVWYIWYGGEASEHRIPTCFGWNHRVARLEVDCLRIGVLFSHGQKQPANETTTSVLCGGSSKRFPVQNVDLDSCR